MQFLFAFAFLLAACRAIMVTSPTQSTVWTIGQDQTITWTSVNTDMSTISVYLVNFSHYPTQTILLKSGVTVSDGQLSISGSYLSAGTGWQINFVPGTNTEEILAQSNQFSIVAAAVASTTAASGSSSTASSTSSSTGSAALPQSGGSSANSTLAATSKSSVNSVSSAALVVALGSLILL